MGNGRLIAAAALVAMLAGCQTGGGSFCRVMTGDDGKPIVRPTKADLKTVSETLAVGLVTVLETGEKECGWKP